MLRRGENPLLAAWRHTLTRCGSSPAIYSATGAVVRSFAQIEDEAEKLARCFEDLLTGSVVAVQIGNSARWPELLLALWARNLIPLPLGEMSASELAPALQMCGASALITENGALDVGLLDAKPVQWKGTPPELLKLTSGTTNVPRAIRFRAAQLLADCENICATMGLTATDLNYGVIPFSHSYGFSNLLTPLLARGVRLVACEDRFPRAILDGLAATRATVLPATPVLFQKLAELQNSTPRPDALRLCISAGSPLPRQTGADFTAKFGLKIHAFYGSSECGGIAYDAGQEASYEDGFVGAPMSGVNLVLPEESGPIVVRSAAVADGYFPEDEPATLGDGRFTPGDLVRGEERGLYLAGRSSEVINVAGRKLNPLEVEARLAEFPGVRQAVVFGVASKLRGEEPIACVAGQDVRRDALLRYCQQTLSAWQVPRDVWLVGEIPSNERGKISRRALAESYRAQFTKTP